MAKKDRISLQEIFDNLYNKELNPGGVEANQANSFSKLRPDGTKVVVHFSLVNEILDNYGLEKTQLGAWENEADNVLDIILDTQYKILKDKGIQESPRGFFGGNYTSVSPEEFKEIIPKLNNYFLGKEVLLDSEDYLDESGEGLKLKYKGNPIVPIDTPTNVVGEGRLVWGSEEFIDAILDDMRASAQLFEFDMEGDLDYLKRNQPEVAKLIEQGKINIANHIEFIDVTRETLDRTDLPPGLDKYKAQDDILMFIEAAQYQQRTQGTGTINGLKIPELGVTDVQAQDPEFKKLLTQQFTDTPTNVVDDVVITSASENLKQTIPTNVDGNIVLYRATTNPNANILSDFTDVNMSNQAGLGRQSFYAIDEMYAYNYSRPSINKNVYKYETNIKPNQVLNIQSPTNAQLGVLEKINITAQDLQKWDIFNIGEVNEKIQNNLDYLLENNIKAIGNNKFGGSLGVFDYEIVPIITEKTQTEIKPVSQLILDPNWKGTDRILNVENELFQSTQSTQWADKYLPIDVNDPNTKYRPVYYVDEEGIGKKAKDFQFSEQPLENNLVKDNLIEVPVDTNTNVNLVKDTYVLSTDTPTNVVGNEFVDNYGKTTTGFIDDLPLEKPVKDLFLNAADSRLKKLGTQLATPGGILDTVDIWEMGVLALVAGAIAYNEIDEIPKITKNTILRTYNLSQGRPIDAPLRIIGLPVLSVSEYDIDFEYAMETLEKGEKVMPTEIAIDYVQEKAEEFEGEGTASGYAYMTPSAKKTDTMETTQKIQPGVQEEKMFEQARPKKTKSAGGSGAKIL